MTATLPSLANLKPNPDWATLPLFDRTGWKRLRFGDVVENCAETCEPAEAGLERFVAMEKGSVLDIDTCSAQSHPPGTGPSGQLRDQRGVCEGVVGGVQRTRVVFAVCGGWFGCWR